MRSSRTGDSNNMRIFSHIFHHVFLQCNTKHISILNIRHFRMHRQTQTNKLFGWTAESENVCKERKFLLFLLVVRRIFRQQKHINGGAAKYYLISFYLSVCLVWIIHSIDKYLINWILIAFTFIFFFSSSSSLLCFSFIMLYIHYLH